MRYDGLSLWGSAPPVEVWWYPPVGSDLGYGVEILVHLGLGSELWVFRTLEFELLVITLYFFRFLF